MVPNKMKQFTLFLSVVFLAASIFAWKSPQAIKHENILKNEFKVITAYPEATMVDFRATHKFASALVVGVYNAETDYSDLKKHYDTELKEHGWVYKEQSAAKRQVSTGAESCYYQKGPYKFTLYYAGNQRNFTYSIALGWGLE